MPQQYEVGKPFPRENSHFGQEIALISLNEAFFDVLYYINEPDEKLINIFRRGPLQYALYSEAAIAFPIFSFYKHRWSFDASINIFKAQEDKIEDWLNTESNAITLFLIDSQTNTLLAIRSIGVRMEYAEKLRDVLEEQWGKYDSKDAVDLMIESLMNAYTTEEMLSKSKIYTL